MGCTVSKVNFNAGEDLYYPGRDVIRYTGSLEFYAYGEQKAHAIRELAERHELDLTASYAYSDSITDAPMLAAVGNPVAVNPDRELRRLAEEQGWEVRNFRRPVRLRTLKSASE